MDYQDNNQQQYDKPNNQQPQYNQPNNNGYINPQPNEPGKGFAITSMVLGIVSFFCFGLATGILAIIFGAVAKNKGYTGGMATAGIVLGVVGLALMFVWWICLGSFSLIPIDF